MKNRGEIAAARRGCRGAVSGVVKEGLAAWEGVLLGKKIRQKLSGELAGVRGVCGKADVK